MNDTELAEYRGGLHILHEQLWHGHLNIRGMQRAYRILDRDRAIWPAVITDECEWLLDQLNAELMMCELDFGANA